MKPELNSKEATGNVISDRQGSGVTKRRGAALRKLKAPAFVGLLAMLAAAFPIRAHAAATLTLNDGVNPLITVSDNGPGDILGSTGAILVQTNVGVWNLTISTAITKPLVGSPTDPVMDLDVQANSTAAGTLTFVFSDNNFGPVPIVGGAYLNSIVTGQLVGGAPSTVTYSVYGDSNNGIGVQSTLVTTVGPGGSPLSLPTVAGDSQPLNLGPSFSLTQVEQFVASGAATITSDASFMVGPPEIVPEPGVMGLVTLGLAMFAIGRPRRK